MLEFACSISENGYRPYRRYSPNDLYKNQDLAAQVIRLVLRPIPVDADRDDHGRGMAVASYIDIRRNVREDAHW